MDKDVREALDRISARMDEALDRISARMDEAERQIRRLSLATGIAAEGITVFTDTVKRYVTGEAQPAAEGDWQLHDDGHEGEETV